MFHPIWVVFVFEGTKTPVYSGCSRTCPLIGRPKSGRKCYITPAFSGVPNKGDKIGAQKRPKKPKHFHCVTTSDKDCLPRELNQRPFHHRGTVYPRRYGPSLTDVATGMVLIFKPMWFSSIIELS